MSSSTPPEALRRIEKCQKTGNPKLDLSSCGLTEVPREIMDLIWLREIDFFNNQINKIEGLNTLSNLTELRFSVNRIEEIENLEALASLTRLILDNNQIGEIENIESLTNLTELDLSFNKISEIKNLERQVVLLELYLHSNKLFEIKNLDQLTVLTKLNLGSNQISEIKNLDRLVNLTELDLRSNQINEIKNLDQLRVLTLLNLSVNKISEIKNLDKLSKLLDLDFFGNQISEIKNLDQLAELNLLSFSSNYISEIKNLDYLIRLEEIDFFGNEISKIEKLEKLSGLRRLHISSNKISEIENLEELNELTHLSLNQNQISEIKNLDKLVKLTHLKLNRNKINEIKGLDKLSELTVLSLYRNKISSIFSGLSISMLKKIKEIDLSNNPIKGTTITDWKSPKAILGYLQSLEDNQVTNYHLKVNIIGEGRIGKTQLLKYWKEGGIYQANEPETHGTLTTQFKIPGTEYKATIWDFGGQSYHHGFHHVFLRPNDFNLVLWRNVLKKEPDYGYWLGTARSFSLPKNNEYITAPLLLVQNVWSEMDIPDQEPTYLPDWVAFPDNQKMQKYRVALGDVFVIDVKNLHRKDELWKARHDYFEGSLYQKMIFHTRIILPTISKKWLAIKEELDQNPIHEITLQKEDFRKKYAHDFDEAALAGLLDYLEFTGNIIKFPKPSSLANYVFPNPPALSDWIYNTVLNKKLVSASEGILDFKTLEKKIGEEEAMIFREIMDEFSLLFIEEDNKDHLVIPQFLPENNNTFKRLILDLIPYSFCLRFADFFHESRIFQFISEYGFYADDKTSYWRYGLVFTIDKVNALVYYDQKKRIVFVHLENKKGRIRIAQDIFDFFAIKVTRTHYSGKRLSQLSKEYDASTSTIVSFLNEQGFEIEYNPNFRLPIEAEALLDSKFQKCKPKPVSFVANSSELMKRILFIGSGYANTREKIDLNNLIEGAQLSTNQKSYIDIKETLEKNTDDIPIGFNVEDQRPIKLDNLTLNLLGMVNQKLPKVFISYSRQDLAFKDELKMHLSILERYDLLKAWSCEEIQAGTWDSQIQTELEEADVIVYMVSQNFMASGYIMEQEVAKGIKMVQENPDKKIICVLVRNCLWKRWSFMEERFKDVLEKDGKEVFSTDLSKYQFLPYHQYKNQEGVAVREEIVALEEWGRYPYHVSSVAFTQVADRILTEVIRRN